MRKPVANPTRPAMAAEDGFFSRWSRRKAQADAPARAPAPAVPTVSVPVSVPAVPPTGVAAQAAAPAPAPVAAQLPEPGASPPPAAPTLADVAQLTPQSDFAPYMGRTVAQAVKNAAMKKLFADPHFNVMDGLDTYIDDYSQPDPIPPAMLRMMNQSQFLGLFDHEKQEEENVETAQVETTATTPAPEALATASHDHPDLRLQQDHAPGQPAADPGART